MDVCSLNIWIETGILCLYCICVTTSGNDGLLRDEGILIMENLKIFLDVLKNEIKIQEILEQIL